MQSEKREERERPRDRERERDRETERERKGGALRFKMRTTNPYFLPARLGLAPISTSLFIISSSPWQDAAVNAVPNRES
jgi:hypothetical protein